MIEGEEREKKREREREYSTKYINYRGLRKNTKGDGYRWLEGFARGKENKKYCERKFVFENRYPYILIIYA